MQGRTLEVLCEATRETYLATARHAALKRACIYDVMFHGPND